MSGPRLHVASADEIERLWPALRAARAFKSAEELRRFYEDGPWRLMLAGSGRAALLQRWRNHAPILAIRGLWCADHEVPDIVQQLRDVALTHGFEMILSPLVPDSVSRPYVAAGMTPHMRIIVLSARADGLARNEATFPRGVRTRLASADDVAALVSLDAICFEEFWRYGPPEMAEHMTTQRLLVAESAEGVLGYTLATIDGVGGTLGRLAVDPQYRRRGVGAGLLAEALGWMVRTGVSTVSLCTQETNAASRALYANAGLTEQRERLVFLARDTGRNPMHPASKDR